MIEIMAIESLFPPLQAMIECGGKGGKPPFPRRIRRVNREGRERRISLYYVASPIRL